MTKGGAPPSEETNRVAPPSCAPAPPSCAPAPPDLSRVAPSPYDLDEVVERLRTANSSLVRHANRVPCGEPLPSRDMVHGVVEALRTVVFPGYFGSAEIRPETLAYHLGHTLDRVRRELQLQIRRGLAFACADRNDFDDCTHECDQKAHDIVGRFLAALPEIQQLLATDVRAAYEGDPAATSPDEAIFCYPGLLAMTNYRIAHALHHLGVPVIPRMITEQAHSITGIDIHPGATIGDHFFMDHGTGVVIGETCLIGSHVRLYQGVTLGAKSFPLDAEGKPIKGIARHPIIEDDVIIYSGATILGRITIGRGSVIGGNVWLTRSIPAGSRILTQPPRQEIFQNGGGI
jgi:serine O-acetyltransferase